MVRLSTYDLSEFLGVFGDDGFQNMFAYQPTLHYFTLVRYS